MRFLQIQVVAAIVALFACIAAAPSGAPTYAPTLTSVTLSPSTLVGGASSLGTVTLSEPAPDGGALVALSSNNISATVPPSVTVPAGAMSATFTVATTPVPATAPTTISASYAGVTVFAVLRITAAGGVETITIQTADYFQSQRQLTVLARDTTQFATLKVFVSSNNKLIGTLTNNHDGTYSGTFSFPRNPVRITIRSSLGASASADVTLR